MTTREANSFNYFQIKVNQSCTKRVRPKKHIWLKNFQSRLRSITWVKAAVVYERTEREVEFEGIYDLILYFGNGDAFFALDFPDLV